LGGVSHVAFCAAATADFCVRLSRGKLKAWSIISPGVDIQRFRPPTSEERRQARLNLGLPTVGTVVLFVGRLHEKKGALVVQELVARYDKLHFLMVGDGPLRPRANKNLTWLPLVPAENMALVYRTADVLLLPSVSESLSLVTLEAMASGVPVIVTRHLPIGDILEDESAGWTAEPTCAGFATCLERVLETPGTKAAVTRRARRLVELHWSNKATERKYLELIKQIATPVPLREALSQKSCGS
jgi:glycosyltransferase involved in cell wall biosynthesis